MDIVLLNLPVINKYPNVEIIEISNTQYCFYAKKELVENRDFDKIEDIKNYKLIVPKAKREIVDKLFKEQGVSINPQYEVSSSYVIKDMVLRKVGVGFGEKMNLEDIKDEIETIDIPKEYPVGVAMLKKDMCNKAVLKLYEMLMSE